MGNCFHRCFGIVTDRRKKYVQSKYSPVDSNFSIEFENLMNDDEPSRDESSRLLTDRERQLLGNRQFDVIIHEQRQKDEAIEARLAQQEEEIEREEEAFYEAKREAARIAKLKKEKEGNSGTNTGWAKDDEWEIAGVEDDFENFLANVKARSLVTRSQVKNGSGDAQSCSNDHSDSVSDSAKNMSSDVEEDQDAAADRELEWESDFVAAEDTKRLVASHTESVTRAS